MFWNVVLEKDGDQLDRSHEKLRSVSKSQGGEEHCTNNTKRKTKRIGHIQRRNCLLKHVIEDKIEGNTGETRRRGIRTKQPLDFLKENRRQLNLKDKPLDCTLWRPQFGKGYGPVVRETT